MLDELTDDCRVYRVIEVAEGEDTKTYGKVGRKIYKSRQENVVDVAKSLNKFGATSLCIKKFY